MSPALIKLTAPKSWTERAFPKLLRYGRTPKGCHFMAWEQPKIFTDEVRASFKTVRTQYDARGGARPTRLHQTDSAV